jgi:KipI family sensor histidine kinase inhibitor
MLAAFGDRAVVVTLDRGGERFAVAARMRHALRDCAVRVGMTTVLVEARVPDARLLDRVAAALAASTSEPALGPPPTSSTVVLPVSYDGEDLHAAAQQLGCPVDQLIAAHLAQRWEVAMLGFAPGFGYLVPAGPALLPWERVTRRATPRMRVPAGSVAIAAGMSAVYPAPLPGGWQLLGRCATPLFDAERADDPALLHAGDQVQFAVAP